MNSKNEHDAPRVAAEQLTADLKADLTVADMIQKQRAKEGNLRQVPRLMSAPVLAQPHTPVYKMHRYFARRPYNLFNRIIENYSRAGDIILDPFCGGGVTVVEGLRLRRRVIGVDLNPIAWLITKMEVMPIDLAALDEGFALVKERVHDRIQRFYHTTCPDCGNAQARVDWVEWSWVVKCPEELCDAEFVLARTKKVRAGHYECPKCQTHFYSGDAQRLPDRMLRLRYRCSCKSKGTKEVTEADRARYEGVVRDFDAVVSAENLYIPDDEFPDGDRQRDDAVFQKGITRFRDLFTPRNLLANALIKKTIDELDVARDVKEMLLFAFSARVSWTSIMTSSTGHGWQHHGYWIPTRYYELNAWKLFEQGYVKGQSTITRGKKYSNEEIGDFCRFAQDYYDLRGDATCLLLNQSSHKLPLPDKSVNVVITDPPFGGNVQYAELADFWVVWLKDLLGIDSLIDNTHEAIATRHSGFETEKTLDHYEEMLYRIFRECHRVLKPKGWMVMTFHNRDIGVWMSLHRAAQRAGFKLPPPEVDKQRGMLYQPPIEDYTRTLHQRAAGSMLGDFVLSFQRQDIPASLAYIKETLEPNEEADLVAQVRELIEYNGGADENLLMSGLIPYLNEKNLLHRLARFNFAQFFDAHFTRKGKKWYTEEQIDTITKELKPLDYIRAEQVTEELIVDYLQSKPKPKQYATLDELLIVIYTSLVNSHRPGIEAIQHVLRRVCESGQLDDKKREVYYLRGAQSVVKTETKPAIEGIQSTLISESDLPATPSHNEIISHIAKFALEQGYQVHAGESEQRKEGALREISSLMQSNVQFGIPAMSFATIKEIDLLVIKQNTIIAAFEVTTTVETANKAINDRYRNLFAGTPNLNIPAYVVVRDVDFDKAQKVLQTVANIQDGISAKVRVLKIGQLDAETLAGLFE